MAGLKRDEHADQASDRAHSRSSASVLGIGYDSFCAHAQAARAVVRQARVADLVAPLGVPAVPASGDRPGPVSMRDRATLRGQQVRRRLAASRTRAPPCARSAHQSPRRFSYDRKLAARRWPGPAAVPSSRLSRRLRRPVLHRCAECHHAAADHRRPPERRVWRARLERRASSRRAPSPRTHGEGDGGLPCRCRRAVAHRDRRAATAAPSNCARPPTGPGRREIAGGFAVC